MMNENNINKINELLANEDFAKKIAEAGSYEKMYELLSAEGMDASYDEFIAYLEECRKAMVAQGLISEDGELSVELLEQISGGVKWGCVALGVGYVAGGAFLVSIGIGGGLAVAASGVGLVATGIYAK